MAKTKAGRLIERRLRACLSGNTSDLGEALRRVFGSRREIEEMFSEWEIILARTIHDASEREKRARRDREADTGA